MHIDARGLKCPQPVIALSRVVADSQATHISIDVDDPAAAIDIPAWCRMRNHHHVSISQHPMYDTHIIEIKRN
jgi:tRNA 2-thiouridine synthesizing protein A